MSRLGIIACLLAACGSGSKPGDDAGPAATATITADLPDTSDAPDVEIERLSAELFVVDREAVYGLLLDITEGDLLAMRGADGVTISGVGLGSYAARLGLKNNDILKTGNGSPLFAKGGIRAALALARKDGALELSTSRDGQDRNIRYVFRESLGKDFAAPRRRNSLPKDVYAFEKVLDELGKGITRKGDTEMEIDRRVLNAIVSNSSLLSRTATRRKYRDPRGFIARAENSVYRELGLSRYDVIKSVDDHETVSNEDFQQGLQQIDSSGTFRVSVSRLGTASVFVYTVVDTSGLDPAALDTAIEDWKKVHESSSSGSKPPRFGSLLTPPTRDPIPGIRKLSDGEYEIERKTIDEILANPTKLSRGARIVPYIKNGTAQGFKLYAIRPSSIWAQLGLNNGDAVRSINGHALTTPDEALDVYTKVRAASHIRVLLSRRGKDVVIVYNVKK